MRVRDHIAVSTAGAALLYPLLGRRVFGAWAGSILIDADHYLWFCAQQRSVNPVAAMRFFNQAESPHNQASRIFHNPLAISALAVVGAWRRQMLPVAVGMALHVAMDAYHEARMGRARSAALQRDNFTCQTCGAKGPGIVTHLIDQPRVLPSYSLDHLVSLCGPCHEAAHAQRVRPAAWRGRALAVMSLLLWKWKAR